MQVSHLARIGDLDRAYVHTYNAASDEFSQKTRGGAVSLANAEDQALPCEIQRIKERFDAILEQVCQGLHGEDGGYGRPRVQSIFLVDHLEVPCLEHHERPVGAIGLYDSV